MTDYYRIVPGPRRDWRGLAKWFTVGAIAGFWAALVILGFL